MHNSCKLCVYSDQAQSSQIPASYLMSLSYMNIHRGCMNIQWICMNIQHGGMINEQGRRNIHTSFMNIKQGPKNIQCGPWI